MTQGKNKKNVSISTANEFIADITQHIPEKSFRLVRYYGWYSNRMRGAREKLEEGSCDGKQEKEPVDISKLESLLHSGGSASKSVGGGSFDLSSLPDGDEDYQLYC
ncbi:MAG: transposase [Thermodesulfobacteriota bacterium]|nr:transposase [Thermodesulfobacteriota bacterium]